MFTKPSSKSVTEAASFVGGGVIGAIASDGVVAILPASTAKFSKIGVAVVSLIIAGSVEAKTNGGKFVQGAFAGMAIKQGTEALREALAGVVTAPSDPSSTAGKLQLAALTPSTFVAPKAIGAGSPYQEYDFQPVAEIPESAWERPITTPTFTGV